MAANPESITYSRLRAKKRKHEPINTFSEIRNTNSLHHPNNPFLRLAPITTGEGYVSNNTVYREEIKKLRRWKKRMSPETYAAHVELVAEQMAEDRFARSGNIVTFSQIAINNPNGQLDLALTGRTVHGEMLEIKEIVKPIIQNEVAEIEDLTEEGAVIFELARIVAVEGYRGTRPDGKNQTTELVEHFIDGPNGVVEVAQELGCDTMLTIAKNQFAKHTYNTSMPFVEGYDYELTPRGLAVAQAYKGYWEENKPKIYVTKVPPKAT